MPTTKTSYKSSFSSSTPLKMSSFATSSGVLKDSALNLQNMLSSNLSAQTALAQARQQGSKIADLKGNLNNNSNLRDLISKYDAAVGSNDDMRLNINALDSRDASLRGGDHSQQALNAASGAAMSKGYGMGGMVGAGNSLGGRDSLESSVYGVATGGGGMENNGYGVATGGNGVYRSENDVYGVANTGTGSGGIGVGAIEGGAIRGGAIGGGAMGGGAIGGGAMGVGAMEGGAMEGGAMGVGAMGVGGMGVGGIGGGAMGYDQSSVSAIGENSLGMKGGYNMAENEGELAMSKGLNMTGNQDSGSFSKRMSMSGGYNMEDNDGGYNMLGNDKNISMKRRLNELQTQGGMASFQGGFGTGEKINMIGNINMEGVGAFQNHTNYLTLSSTKTFKIFSSGNSPKMLVYYDNTLGLASGVHNGRLEEKGDYIDEFTFFIHNTPGDVYPEYLVSIGNSTTHNHGFVYEDDILEAYNDSDSINHPLMQRINENKHQLKHAYHDKNNSPFHEHFRHLHSLNDENTSNHHYDHNLGNNNPVQGYSSLSHHGHFNNTHNAGHSCRNHHEDLNNTESFQGYSSLSYHEDSDDTHSHNNSHLFNNHHGHSNNSHNSGHSCGIHPEDSNNAHNNSNMFNNHHGHSNNSHNSGHSCKIHTDMDNAHIHHNLYHKNPDPINHRNRQLAHTEMMYLTNQNNLLIPDYHGSLLIFHHLGLEYYEILSKDLCLTRTYQNNGNTEKLVFDVCKKTGDQKFKLWDINTIKDENYDFYDFEADLDKHRVNKSYKSSMGYTDFKREAENIPQIYNNNLYKKMYLSRYK